MKYLCLLIIISCSSLTKEECQKQNWFELGKQDASNGVVQPKTSDYRHDCSEHGLKIKSIDYLKGFETGLLDYCTYWQGKSNAEAGDDPHPLCEEVNSQYRSGYLYGRKKYEKIQLEEKLIADNGGKKCTSQFDCPIEGRCSDDKCEGSEMTCSFNSDCKAYGRCESVSSWTDSMSHVSVNVCKES